MGIYNCQDTLSLSIESILNQTYKNWELIMCDDASTDNTYNIAESYRVKNPNQIILIRNNKNSGLASSLNHCLQYATGKYVARMDGDDLSEPVRFEKQVDFLKRNPDIHLVGSSMSVFNGSKYCGINKYKPYPDKFDLRFGPCFAHATIFTYKYVYDHLGGYTVSKLLTRTQDYELWFRFFKAGFRGHNLEEPLYVVIEDEKTLKRRKLIVYSRAVFIRFAGFKLLNYPLKYYPYILKPVVAMFVPVRKKIRYYNEYAGAYPDLLGAKK